MHRLSLIVDIYDRLREESVLDCVRSAVTYLASEQESNSIYLWSRLHYQLRSSALPPSELSEANSVVIAGLAQALVESAEEVDLDDIGSVARKLREAMDNDAACHVVRKALRTFITNIEVIVDQIDSIDELDAVESQLNRLMVEYDLVDTRADGTFEYRRTRLIELEMEDEDGYKPMVSRPRTAISDDGSDQQIKSMFRGLLGSQ